MVFFRPTFFFRARAPDKFRQFPLNFWRQLQNHIGLLKKKNEDVRCLYKLNGFLRFLSHVSMRASNGEQKGSPLAEETDHTLPSA